MHPNTAAKSSKPREIFNFSRDSIGNPKMVMKGVRPEFDGEIGSEKHGSNGIGDCEVCSFNWTILVGCVSTSRSNIAVELLEQLVDLGENVLVADTRGMVLEEMTQPLQRCSFRDPSITVQTMSEVIRDKNLGCFTVNAKAVFLSILILGLGARERKVDGQALTRDSRSVRGIVPSRFFGLLCLCASRTLIESRGCVSKLGHALDVFVGIAQVTIAWMSQPLMPEQTLSLSLE